MNDEEGNLAVLERSYLPFATFGQLRLEGFSCYTVECPWADNKKFVSCLPEGTYFLDPYYSAEWGDTCCLVNCDLGVYTFQVMTAKRYGCIIHPANYSAQLKGCLAPGNKFGVVDGHWSVMDSRETFSRLIDAIKRADVRRIMVKSYLPHLAKPIEEV